MSKIMKRHGLTCLFLLAGWLTAMAQGVVTVHGTVSSEQGAPQAGIEIWITGYSAADSTVVFTTTLTGPDGQYFAALTLPDPNGAGFVEVAMIDCFGVIQSQSFPVANGSAEIQADFVYCQGIQFDSCAVWIVEDGQPPFFVQLTALTPPIPGVEFLWNTGETSQSIVPQASGTYCVTASFPFGCDTMACIDVVLDSMSGCFAYIVSYPNNDGTYNLEAVGTGTPPFTYAWDNGANTPWLQGVGPGTYCVAVVDVTGCAYTTCMFVDDFSFCEAYIIEDPAGGLSANSFGQEPFTYLWSTGETTQSIYPANPGLYCVTVTAADSCTAFTCIETGWGGDSCFAYVNVYFPDSLTVGLEAITYGVGPYTYLWNTGDTTASIQPIDPALGYCVTISDGADCTTEACYDPTHFCYGWVNVEYADTNQAVLSVYTDPIFNLPGGQSPVYLWSTGDTTAVITVDTSGDYCVTISLAAGCTVESCATVDFEGLGQECYVWIQQYPDSSGQWIADAQAWGWGDFDYQWSTGDTTNLINLNPGEFACVTVTSSFGCVTEACTDTISPCQPFIGMTYLNNTEVLLQAYFPLDPNQSASYLWSTGDTTAAIIVSAEGTYCVTVSGFGCIGQACTEVVFNGPDSCGVIIVTEPHPAGLLYTAVAWGVPPFAYNWSNGSTEQSFIVDLGPLDYCVTVTDANGCVSTDCFATFDSCWINLTYANQNGNIIFATPSDPLSWITWSTGDSLSQWIEIEEPGTYCATVTTTWGCTATACITIDSLYPGIGNVISGTVFGDTLSVLTASVYAYRLVDNTQDEYVLFASTPVGQQGFYMFSNLPDGLYLLKAEGDAGTATADAYIPTYHYQAASWEEATPHVLPNWLPVTTDIRMIRTTGLQGGGVIGGAVFDPEGLVAGEELELRGAGGLGGILILLKNVEGLPLQYIYTEDDGSFRFEALPFGTYRLAFDLPGYHSPDVWVTISQGEPEKLEVNLPVSGITAVQDPGVELITLYPNPARDVLYVPVPGQESEYAVRMTDVQGRVVFAGSMAPQGGVIRIDVSRYASGVYQVQVFGPQRVHVGRWVRQE